MAYEFWLITLPQGQKVRGEALDDHINRELTELVGRGWEPVSIARDDVISRVSFLLKKALP